MAINFPNNPTANDTVVINDQTYVFDGVKWTILDSDNISSVEISETAPSSPSSGDLWWNSTTGTMKIYYDDGNTQQWVDASPTLQSDFVIKNDNVIDTPVAILPDVNSTIAIDETFTLESSEYSDSLGVSVHASSDWQISKIHSLLRYQNQK